MQVKVPNNIIKSMQLLRSWERQNLPHCKTSVGYHVFLCLAVSLSTDEFRLKEIYHSLPFSERTIRLQLRNLESDGWIEMPNKDSDLRHKDIHISNKFKEVVISWVNEIEKSLNAGGRMPKR